MFEAGRFFRKGNVTSRHELATLISKSLPRQRDVTPYRSPVCADVLRGARADVTDFSYMTLMNTSAVKHYMLKVKGKGRPRTDHEGPELEKRYSSTSYFNLSARWCGWSRPRSDRFTTRKEPVPIGSWIGSRTGIDRCGKSRLQRDSIHGPSSPQPLATATELSRPKCRMISYCNSYVA